MWRSRFRLRLRPRPIGPEAWDWNGFYGGINAGYSFGNAQNAWNIIAPPTNFLVVGTDSERLNGPLGGIQAGWNWQYSVFLAGIEADVDFGHVSGNQTFNSAFAVTTPVSASIPNSGTIAIPHSFRLEWVGTVRGRLGFVWGPVLVYGTGGFAWATTKQQLTGAATKTSDGSTQVFLVPTDLGTDLAGWTAGGGGEVAFGNNWSVRAEYLFLDFRNSSQGFATQSVFGGAPPVGPGTITTRVTDNIVRLGLNYKFEPF